MAPAITLRPRAPAVPPSGIVVLESPLAPAEPGYRDPLRPRGALRFSRRWFAPQLLFLAVFCVFWDGILAGIYGGAIRNDRFTPALVFTLVHVVVGAWLTYSTLAGLVNRTRVEVANGVLRVVHGPLPWPGERAIPVEDVAQLYCEEVVTTSKSGIRTSFALSLVRRSDASRVRVLSDLPTAAHARFLEHRIEEHLGLADVDVPGEHLG